MKLGIEIKGLKALQADFIRGSQELSREVKAAMVKSVNVVKNYAQDVVPYKTGTLRRSIWTDVKDQGFRGEVNQDSNIANYGIFVEMGTKRMKARPYMRPAIDANIDKVKSYFNEAVSSIMNILKDK